MANNKRNVQFFRNSATISAFANHQLALEAADTKLQAIAQNPGLLDGEIVLYRYTITGNTQVHTIVGVVCENDNGKHIEILGNYDILNGKIEGLHTTITTETATAISNAINGLDGDATIATVTDGVVTLKTYIKEIDGIIQNPENDTEITLAKVATTGSYNDLSDTPTIPVVNDGKLTIKQGTTTLGEFTANQSTGTTIEIPVPTEQVQSDWNETNTSSKSFILNKPNVATLDSSGKIPTSQLPSYVDDVVEYANSDAFPQPGESGKIYMDASSGDIYRWTGSQYLKISGIIGAQGEKGAQGFQGFQGKSGIDGIQGFQGIQGLQGIQGVQGYQGYQGTQGYQGLQGFQGYQGKSGVDGAQGYQGYQGLQGFQGKGVAEVYVHYSDNYQPGISPITAGEYTLAEYEALWNDMPYANQQDFNSIMWSITTSSNYTNTFISPDLVMTHPEFRPTSNPEGNYVCFYGRGQNGLQGLQGETGTQGYQGLQGFQGYQGKSGVDGEQGEQGIQGFQGFQGYQGLQGTALTVVNGDKILTQTGTNVSSTLSLTYDSTNKLIKLLGVNNTEISSFDATDFIKDGMLESAELVTNPTGQEAGDYIKLTFNTDAGKNPIYINVSDLVDTYTSGDSKTLTVSDYTITPVTATVAANATGLAVAGDVHAKIAATKGQDIQTITGETATTQGNYIDVKVTATKGENNDNYTLSTTSNVTTQAVSTATSTANGLATASDVKTYVDAKVGSAYTATGELTMSDGREITHNESGVITSADKQENPDMTSKKIGGVATGENNTATITVPVIEVNAYGHVIRLEEDSYTVTYPTSSVVAGNGITVTPSTSGNNTAYTVGVKLNSNTNDMLTVDGNGLNLNSTWDCGEYL